MSRLLALTVSASLLVVLSVGGEAVAAAKPATKASTLKALVKQTNALPSSAASKAKRLQLKRIALHSRKAAVKKPCTSVKDLARYRRILSHVKVKSGKRYRKVARRISALGPASLQASRLLLADKRTKRCGGGVKPSNLSNAKTTVLKSDENGMRVRVKLPKLAFSARTGGGKSWTQLVLPNTDAPGAPGTPGIPVASSTFGVPDGAKVTVGPGGTSSYTIDGVDVYPVQPESVDADTTPPNFLKGGFASKPFKLNTKAYKHKGFVPAVQADGGILGTSRDLTIGDLKIPAAQYDPTKKKLKVLNSVDVTVKFEGGDHTFSDELGSPWEQAQRRLVASLVNGGIVKTKLPFILRRCGEEMLVVTNPSTRPAADQFATARRAAGIRTKVVETGAGAGQIGTTAVQIQTFIRSELTRLLCIHPSYVTIIGDDKLVPTFPGISGIPSDLQYSMRNDADELPDVAVGRIIGNDLGEVTTAVTKIIGYETTAPSAGDFLTHATLAAQFQDDDNDGQENRTFIQFAETVRNGLVGRGVTVDRIYGESPGNNPQRFNDGTNLPASLKKPTFAWNGTGADVSNAWNAGRFLMIHRDHGWSDGWGTPGYGTADVNALTNGSKLPVVMSINCSSAAYDYDDTSFAQSSLVKADGGSVGVFGDTRDSPSWHNSQLGLGLVDALLPSVLPSEGPATKQRMGDALINGKLRLAGLAPPGSDGSTRNELYLWHYFGDPSMQLWGGGSPPLVFNPALFKAVAKEFGPPNPGDPPFVVEVTLPKELAGQPISLLRNGEVIGKAMAGDGVATIPAAFGDGSVKPGELRVAMEPDGAQPVSAPVDLPSSALTQNCPGSVQFNGNGPTNLTVTGTLTGPPAGSAVDVTFQAPPLQNGPGRTVVQHPTTNANGEWTTTLSTQDRQEIGTWTVSSSYPEGHGFTASQAGPCSFDVTDGG